MNELAKLSDFEDRAEQAVKDVNRGMERFAQELKQIKDLGLWKGGYDSFEDYCNTRWSKTVRTVQRALKAHAVRQKLLAAAPEAGKEAIQKASTTSILNAGRDYVSNPEGQSSFPLSADCVNRETGLSEGGSFPAEFSKVQSEEWSKTENNIDHLVIGRNKPTATKTADFYSSGPSTAVAVRTGKTVEGNPVVRVVGVDPSRGDDRSAIGVFDGKTFTQISPAMLANVLREYPLKDESHRPYLLQLAGCIERGEPA